MIDLRTTLLARQVIAPGIYDAADRRHGRIGRVRGAVRLRRGHRLIRGWGDRISAWWQ